MKKAPVAESPDSYARSEQGRVLIRSGSLSLRVKAPDAIRPTIEKVALDVGGRVQSWSSNDDNWLTMKLRVPEPKLDEAMDRIAGLGKVVGRSLKSEDVTEELIDLEARLKNLRALRDRLRSYLDQAKDLKEILEVERELARVQTELESLEAKLKVLQDRVAMSELDVQVSKKSWL
jgi:ribosomal protein L29